MRSHRKERVARAIRDIVSDAIARRINDPRLAPLTTVSRVEVSSDMSLATVYLTVVGGEAVERRSIAALSHATGFVRHLVADQLEVRQCPEIRFKIDETVKKIRETLHLLDENRRREPHIYAEPKAPGIVVEPDDAVDEAGDEAVMEGEENVDPSRGGGE